MPTPNEEADACSCDVCAEITDYHALPTDWRRYAEELEADNYNLLQEVAELERELEEERARCSNCGKHR
jgi:hypothetical protein